MLRISPVVGCAILPNLKAWSGPRHGQIDDACLIYNRLDSIGIALFIQSHGTSVGVEGKLLRVKAVII